MTHKAAVLGGVAGLASGAITAVFRNHLDFRYAGLVFACSLGACLIPWKRAHIRTRSTWLDIVSLLLFGALAPWLTIAAFALGARTVESANLSFHFWGKYGVPPLIGIVTATLGWDVCVAFFTRVFANKFEVRSLVLLVSGSMAVLCLSLFLDYITGRRVPFVAVVIGEQVLSGLVVGLQMQGLNPGFTSPFLAESRSV